MSAGNPKELHAEAQRLFGEKKFTESLTLLDKLAEQFPHDPNIAYARARCLVAMNRLNDAHPICQQLRDVYGHQRGGELLAFIESKIAPPMSAFEVPESKPRYAPASAQAQSGGGKKWMLAAAAVVVIAGAAGAYFVLGGSSDDSKVAAAVPLPRDLPVPDQPTYFADVAPILNDNCTICHHQGEAVPMVLTSYEQIRPWAKSIRTMIESRQMPPWHADPSVGEWRNDRRLAQRDIDTVIKWIDQGTPRGNPEDGPEPPVYTDGWKIGEPDVVLTASSQTLPAELEDEYRYVFVPTGFAQDRWISAAEIRPGNYNVVHHVIVFTADPAKGRSGLEGSIGGYAPGSPPLVMENGRGMKISAGEMLVLQMHYHKEPGTEERDQTTIGLKFADGAITKELRFGTLGTEKFAIPPHDSYFPVEAKLTVDQDVHLEQIVPHMHLRGTDMRVWADFPDGRRQDLIFVPKYDFNWQTFYELAKPIALPKGTELHAVAHYDNSKNNPFNPNPAETVRWGEPTTAEMMYAFFMYTADNEKLKAKDPGGP